MDLDEHLIGAGFLERDISGLQVVVRSQLGGAAVSSREYITIDESHSLLVRSIPWLSVDA